MAVSSKAWTSSVSPWMRWTASAAWTRPEDHDAYDRAQIYDGYRAGHEVQGQGSDGDGLPALFHNTSLGHA